MNIAIIAAMAENRAIGKNNMLLWHLSDDLKRFKRITTGNTVIMGRKTYESIGKPLPGRQNIVLTRDKEFEAKGIDVAHSPEEALAKAENEDVFIIGGGEIYRRFLSLADTLYLTIVYGIYDGDTYFPDIDFDNYERLERIEVNDPPRHCFLTLKRKEPGTEQATE